MTAEGRVMHKAGHKSGRRREEMKNTYSIGNFNGYKVIYCKETDTYILDTEGDPVTSEEFSLNEMFGTDDELDILRNIDLTLANQKALEDLMNYSSGFKFWIETKEA